MDTQVTAFLETVDEKKRADSLRLIEIMSELTGCEPAMWGPSIIGFDSYHYVYESGHEGDAALVGFSPRKAQFSLYLAQGFPGRDELLAKFGKHKSGAACIYFKRLSEIDESVLREMITRSNEYIRGLYPKA